MKIQPIVEGHGDVKALPVLLRRLVQEAHVAALSIGRPIRRPRSKLVKKEGVQQAVRLALLQPECGAVLVLFDGESDCPADLGPTVQTWATAAADGTPCQVVLAHREYEAWFLAAIESLRGRRGVLIDAARHPDPERHRGAKEQLESRMQPSASYLETADQPALTELFSRPAAYRRHDRTGSWPSTTPPPHLAAVWGESLGPIVFVGLAPSRSASPLLVDFVHLLQ